MSLLFNQCQIDVVVQSTSRMSINEKTICIAGWLTSAFTAPVHLKQKLILIFEYPKVVNLGLLI